MQKIEIWINWLRLIVLDLDQNHRNIIYYNIYQPRFMIDLSQKYLINIGYKWL